MWTIARVIERVACPPAYLLSQAFQHAKQPDRLPWLLPGDTLGSDICHDPGKADHVGNASRACFRTLWFHRLKRTRQRCCCRDAYAVEK